MANKKSGLGKGLGQLFLENSVDELVANNTLPLEEIVDVYKRQVRHLKVRHHRLPKALHLYIFTVILTDGHAGVNDIGNGQDVYKRQPSPCRNTKPSSRSCSLRFLVLHLLPNRDDGAQIRHHPGHRLGNMRHLRRRVFPAKRQPQGAVGHLHRYADEMCIRDRYQ